MPADLVAAVYEASSGLLVAAAWILARRIEGVRRDH